MITLRVKNTETDIFWDIPEVDFIQEFVALRHKLSYRPEGYLFSPKYRRRQWDGWKRLAWRNKKRCYFPTGLLSIVKQQFKERSVKYQIFDHRKKPEPNIDLTYNEKDYKLRDYQQRVVDTALEKGRGIIMAATGSGKTTIGAGIIHRCSVKPFVFLVTSIDLLEQAKDRLSAALFQNGSNLKVGRIGGGVIDIQDINVMTIQTAVRALGKKFIRFDADTKSDKMEKSLLQKHKKEIVGILQEARGAICDEAQHWRADMCQIVTKSLKNAYFLFGCSGTPYRDQGDDLLIQSCFGKNICEIKASELIRKGYLVPPHIHFIHINPIPSKYKTWQNIYKEKIVEDDYYNTLVANLAEQYISTGSLMLILVQQIEHGKRLEEMIDGSLFVCGDSPKNERISALKKLRNKYIRCMITTSIWDEGIDCRALDTLILAGGGRSPTRAMQRVGRTLRPFPGKDCATVIDFFVHEKYLESHAKSRERMYKTEEEFHIEHNFID